MLNISRGARCNLLFPALILFMGGQCSFATAQTAVNADLEVRMEITGGCAIENVQPIDFGQAALLTTDRAATGAFDVRCTNDLGYTVRLGPGLNADGTTRRMAGGGQFIAYELYSDSSRQTLWGQAQGQAVLRTGTGDADTLTVYGAVPPQTTPAGGSYTDTVTITVSY